MASTVVSKEGEGKEGERERESDSREPRQLWKTIRNGQAMASLGRPSVCDMAREGTRRQQSSLTCPQRNKRDFDWHTFQSNAVVFQYADDYYETTTTTDDDSVAI